MKGISWFKAESYTECIENQNKMCNEIKFERESRIFNIKEWFAAEIRMIVEK